MTLRFGSSPAGRRLLLAHAVLPMVTQTALGVAAMAQVTLVRFPTGGKSRMIRSVRGSIFVTEFPSPPIPPVVQTAPAPTATTPGCSAARSRPCRTCSVCGSMSKSSAPRRDFAVTGSDRLEPAAYAVGAGADPRGPVAEGNRRCAVMQAFHRSDPVGAEVDERDR